MTKHSSVKQLDDHILVHVAFDFDYTQFIHLDRAVEGRDTVVFS